MTSRTGWHCHIVAGSFLAVVSGVAAFGCSDERLDLKPPTVTAATTARPLSPVAADVPQAPTVSAATESKRANRVLNNLRARFDQPEVAGTGAKSPLSPGIARSFYPEGIGLGARFAASAGDVSAGVVHPGQSNGLLHVDDVTTGVSADVELMGAHPADAEVTDGYVVYPDAHASAETLLRRALPNGSEDFLSFEKRPRSAVIAYKLKLGSGVRGLRCRHLFTDRVFPIL